MLLKTIYPTQSVVLPMQPQINRHPKLLWLDTGIVNYVAGIRDELYDSSDIQDVYRGRIAEHIVGQELIGLDCNISSQQSFWHKDKSEAEVDYLFLYESKLIPIEVKSGKKYTTTSLNRFREKFKTRIGESYIIHPRNLIIKDNIVCIPAYMTFCL